MPPHELMGQPELLAQLPDFILIQIFQRFDDEPGINHLLHRLYTVVVRLDFVRVLRGSRLDGIGIDGALPEHPNVASRRLS